MEYLVRLTKIRSNHKNLRTDEIEGVTLDLPKEGKYFQMFGKGLEFGTRAITTTTIKKVEQMGSEYLFHTLNSTYKLEVMDEFKEEAQTPSE